MEQGPGTNPEPFFYKDRRWGVRVVSGKGRLFFHVDCPYDGIDERFDDILDWEVIGNRYSPLFLFGDYSGVPTSWLDKPVFKQSCPPSNPNAIAFFHPVVIEREPKPITECEHLTGFQGSLKTHSCRKNIYRICDNMRVAEWWSEDNDSLRMSYIEHLDNTKFVLCPRGRGLNSIRFFEALRMGRIPVLISDDTKLPMEDRIDYSRFMVRMPENDISYEYIHYWICSHDLADASKEARKVSLEWFDDSEKFIKELE